MNRLLFFPSALQSGELGFRKRRILGYALGGGLQNYGSLLPLSRTFSQSVEIPKILNDLSAPPPTPEYAPG